MRKAGQTTLTILKENPADILDHAKKGYHAGRYTCVNLENSVIGGIYAYCILSYRRYFIIVRVFGIDSDSCQYYSQSFSYSF